MWDDFHGAAPGAGDHPVDLPVPKDVADDQWYQVAPKATARTENVREWIRGEDVLFYRTDPY